MHPTGENSILYNGPQQLQAKVARCDLIRKYYSTLKKRDANHWEKGDHSGARFDLCTVYGHMFLTPPSLVDSSVCLSGVMQPGYVWRPSYTTGVIED